MSHTLSFFTLLLAFSRADAYFVQFLLHCQFNSYDGHNAVYVEELYFNKRLAWQYNSTLGEVIGFTETGKELADVLNNNTNFMTWKTNYCKGKAPLVYNSSMTTVEPSVWLRSVEAAGSKHPGTLICSVYKFYPKQIRVTWLRNGEEVTSDVTSTEALPNGNWLYQIHSYLEYTPRPGETITCMVEHASLKEPKLYDWEPSSGEKIKITVGTAGLLLGLVFVVAGLIYYKRKSSLRVLVPTAEVSHAEDTL